MTQAQPLCNVCFEPAKVLKTIQGYKENSFYDILHCGQCDTSFIRNDASAETELIYDLIYNHGNQVPGYNRYYTYADKVLEEHKPLHYLADTEDMYWAIADCIEKKIITKDMKLIEVGCGLGYLSYALHEDGFDIMGIDISEKAISKARQKYGDYYKCMDIYKMVEEGNEQFDIILLTEVIEHVTDPVDFIEALSMLLNPGGKIIITTPNKSAYPPQVSWDTELPPVHHYWFSEKSIRTIASNLKLTCRFVDFSPFNKDHLDKTKFSRYKEPERKPVLSSTGNVLAHKPKTRKEKVSMLLRKLNVMKIISRVWISIKANKEDWHRRQTMCAILSGEL
ncbi:class I SAM-dependent methyltransferase [Spirosoma radiotolerans]|uniref:Methyltransferase type 12 n=1 Tax=Spirosoma radiotolerans TaxID=1379870 RepID=A0A0E3ZVV3_9BACT|nr:methyltransferase [Spirosoma radiotolerans]AKD55338.1 hypothetical protein SD10_10950 [Spirosoma radiotolerans]